LGIIASEVIQHAKCVVIHRWKCSGILAGHGVIERPYSDNMSHGCLFDFHRDNAGVYSSSRLI